MVPWPKCSTLRPEQSDKLSNATHSLQLCPGTFYNPFSLSSTTPHPYFKPVWIESCHLRSTEANTRTSSSDALLTHVSWHVRLIFYLFSHRVIAQGGLGGFFGSVEGEELDRKVSLLKAEGVQLVEADTSQNNKGKSTTRDRDTKTAPLETEEVKKHGRKSADAEHTPLVFSSAVIDSSSILDGDSLQNAIQKAREEKKKGFHFSTTNSTDGLPSSEPKI